MVQRDIIERLIQDIAKVIAKLMLHKDWQESLPILEKAYIDYLPFSSAEMKEQPLEGFMDWLIQRQKCTHHHLEALSELMLAEARLAHTTDKLTWQKLDVLLEYVDQNNVVYNLDRQAAIKWIRQQIDLT